MKAKEANKLENKNELWLCLRFTHLSLNSLDIAVDSSPAQAVSYQQKVWQHNRLASHNGIKSGMNVSHARTLAPELVLHAREPQKEAQKYKNLSHWAYRFSSLVSAYTRDSLLIEIGKSIKLFNSLNSIINVINCELSTFKIAYETGVGITPKAAYAMSFSDSALEDCALAKLELNPNTIKQLHRCGFTFLKDINNVAKAELGQRFGSDFLTYLEQLYGSLADPQIAVIPPETFYSRVDFAEPISNLLWIQQQLDKLLTRLHEFISQRQLICHCFSWRFFFLTPAEGSLFTPAEGSLCTRAEGSLLTSAGGSSSAEGSLPQPAEGSSLPSVEGSLPQHAEGSSSHERASANKSRTKTVTIALSAKQNSLQTLQSLSHLKLSHIQLDWEFSSIELKCTELSPKQLFNDDLFSSYADQEPFKQLIDRLSSRLGDKAVFGVQANTEQLPELANAQLWAQEQKPPTYCERPLKASYQSNMPLNDQPLGLLTRPQKLAQHAKQPYLEGPLSIIHGPDRLSSHWWETLQSRDYFIARQRSGRLLWVFYDRAQKNWFLHGLFS